MPQLENVKWFQFDFTVGKTVSGVYRPLFMVVSVQAERLEHGFFLRAYRASTIVCHQLILSGVDVCLLLFRDSQLSG